MAMQAKLQMLEETCVSRQLVHSSMCEALQAKTKSPYLPLMLWGLEGRHGC